MKFKFSLTLVGVAFLATPAKAADPGYTVVSNRSASRDSPGYIIVQSRSARIYTAPVQAQQGESAEPVPARAPVNNALVYVVRDRSSGPTQDWSGAYVGVQGGYDRQDGKATDNGGNSVRPKPKAALVGGFVGYNYQLDQSPVVVGIETEGTYSKLNGRDSIDNFGVLKSRVSGATRLRVGIALDRVLIYAAGGAAYTRQELEFVNPAVDESAKKETLGWTVGGGVDFAISPNLFLRGEYRHTDYGSAKYEIVGANFRTKVKENRLLGGIAYKFD